MKKKKSFRLGNFVGTPVPLLPQSIYGLFLRSQFVDDDGKKGRSTSTLVSASLDGPKLEDFAEILNRAERVKRTIYPANTIVDYWYVEPVRTF